MPSLIMNALRGSFSADAMGLGFQRWTEDVSMIVKTLFAACAAACAACCLADVPDWPSDFWEKIAVHDAAIAPSGTQIGTGTVAVETFSFQTIESEAFGTAEHPFATVWPLYGDSPLVWIDGVGPGILLLVR